MEPFENNDMEFETESAPEPETESSAYHGAGTGRKESPYAMLEVFRNKM